ncbi:MAG: YqiA/YcfP family alpha/beta fold hydrolase [Campylobacterota bacterium]|nr:YqiA/YcfP family alpha/beta fold hydrolase [Campylobacterota bacterium]
MIIYIHGFGGSGEGSKAKAFREYFKTKEKGFIAPSLSYVPELAIKTLEELIESYEEDVALIGSSLGGFYAAYLSQKYNLKTVLLNPSIYPSKTLKNYIGYAPNFYDESCFEWSEHHIDMLDSYLQNNINKSKFMLLVQKGDELLNYQEAVDKYKDAYIIAEEGGSHQFNGIELYFDKIKAFLLDE